MQFKHVRNIKKIQVISNESHVGKWPFENSRLKGNQNFTIENEMRDKKKLQIL